MQSKQPAQPQPQLTPATNVASRGLNREQRRRRAKQLGVDWPTYRAVELLAVSTKR